MTKVRAVSKAGQVRRGADDYPGKSIRDLDGILWRWFARYIRLRDSDEKGFVRCISCGGPFQLWTVENGKLRTFSTVHAGHYFNQGSSHRAVKYDETNVNAQCCHCNTFLEGNKQGYREGFLRKWGPAKLDLLELRKQNRTKWPRFYYVQMIEEYKDKVKAMEKRILDNHKDGAAGA